MRKTKRWLTALGVLLCLAGAGLFFYPTFREARTADEVDAIEQQFIEQRQEALKTESSQGQSEDDIEIPTDNEGAAVTGGGDESSEASDADAAAAQAAYLKQTLLPDLYQSFVAYNQDLSASGQHITDAFSYEQPPVDLSLNHDSAVIGYIEVPDMRVRLPLLLGASMDNLAQGAAVLSQTSMPIGGTDTNCVIAGHRGWRGSAYFQFIDEMKIGSYVYITNPWETLAYRVTDIKIVDPSAVSEVLIQPGKDMVTLVSCHPYVIGGGPERYLVFCERSEFPSAADRSSDDGQAGQTTAPSDTTVSQETGETSDLPVAQIRGESTGLTDVEQILRIALPVLVALALAVIFWLRRRKKKDAKDDFR